MPDIRLDHVTKTFPGDVVAVDGIDLTIKDGEFMILLGPSGCGKSTTLRMIAGLEPITKGDLYIGDKRVNEVDPKDRDLAFVFQSYALFPHMTVAGNLAFGMRLRKVPADEIERRMREVAAMLGIEALLERKPRELSGGQRQRVALGRALLRDPVAFLLDEPLSNLDAKLRAQMRTELVRLHRKVGRTIIHVTHDQVEAMTMGERICIMNEGRIVQVGAPMDVYRNPADTFVAGFLASPPMNLVPGRIADGHVEAGGIAVPAEGVDGDHGREVVLGIRPEDLHETPTGADPVAVELEVVAVEALGPEVVLVGEVRGSGQELSARLGRDFEARSGDGQTLYLDRSRIHLFDARTTRAITNGQA